MTRATLVLAVGAAAALAAACPTTTPPPTGPGPGPGPGTGGPGDEPPPPALRAAGEACDAGDQCESGVCEGEGCGAGAGVCVATDRVCTMDIASYCGCDGQTFEASGSCAGRLFAHRGACEDDGGNGGGNAGGGQARADGEPCSTAADCASGICEGEGCGPDEGVCAPKGRACTRDLRRYCGCDGVTFRGSGSCPNKRFAHRGECTAKRADGGSCLSGDECASGICEGQGCGDDAPGTCMSKQRMCTADLRPYCGCDGSTFQASGTCPGRRYGQRGKCG